MRLFIFLLVAVLLLFQYDFWFGKNGYLDHQRISQEIQEHKQENEKLMQRNQVLAAEIKDLKQGFDAIEEKARADLKMIKPNEVFYHIVKDSK